MTLAEFRRVYPTAAFTVSSGKLFTYRYYQNPQAKATLVLLTGGIGLSDLFYKHFARFARDFSVLTFDYQLQFGDNGEFADAVAELLRHLKEKVWLVGQSLGGVVAQVIASRHPEVVEGLVLSNTCSLSGNMSKAGYQDLMKIIESQRKFKKWLAFLPFPLIKRMMRWAVMKKKTDGFTAQEKAAIVFHFPFPPLRCIVLHRPLNILPHLLATSFNRHFPLQHLERTRLRLFLPEIGCVSLFLFSFDPQSFRLCFCAGCYFLITVRNRRQVPRMGIFL